VQGLNLTAARGILTTRATRWWRWRTGWASPGADGACLLARTTGHSGV